MFPGVFASTVREEGMADLREDVRIHALLVDDDGRLQTNARDFLEPYGCKISSLHDGRGIEAALEELKPDIVLLDVMLPGDDGFIVLQRLRAVSSIPVIMLTARGNDADRIVGLEMGADDYLVKPYSQQDLIESVSKLLNFSLIREEPIELTDRDGVLARIRPDNILYIKSELRNMHVHTTTGLFISTGTRLSVFADSLPSYFARCHKSFVVNLHHVDTYDKVTAMVSLDTPDYQWIPVGRKYATEFGHRLKASTAARKHVEQA